MTLRYSITPLQTVDPARRIGRLLSAVSERPLRTQAVHAAISKPEDGFTTNRRKTRSALHAARANGWVLWEADTVEITDAGRAALASAAMERAA